jgi:UDP-N-acetylmuramate dehydrogenase
MKILENISLAEYTTLRIGGRALFFVAVQNKVELQAALDFAREQKVPFFILGGGSNILVSDEGFEGLVIRLEMKGVSYEEKGDEVLVTAMAGEVWDEIVAKTVDDGLWGLENLSLVPGTVGAAPVQNIGAYGTEVMQVIESVTAIDSITGEERNFTNAECRFSYRDSIFKTDAGKKYVITSVIFKLSKNPKPNLSYKELRECFGAHTNPSLLEIRNAVISIRRSKFPDLAKFGTAGSFWKNPIIEKPLFDVLKKQFPLIPWFPVDGDRFKIPLAWVLDNVLGLKGFSMENAGLYEKQPLVLVASRGCTEKEVKALAKHVFKAVFGATGIEIEPEVQFIG